MKYLKIILLTCISFGFVNIAYAQCDQQDQMQAYRCLEQQLKSDKSKMNKLYQQVYNQYDSKNKSLLEKSQKAWLSYRDAQCDELMGSLTYGALGLASGFAYLNCQIHSTEFRLKELKSLVEN